MATELIQGYRLSPQQRRVWRLQQLDGGSYRTLAGVLVEGPLDKNRLQAALAAVLARHEILRTDFRHVPGMSFPLQVVNSEAASAIDFHDLAEPGPADENGRLDQLFRRLMREPLAANGGTPLQVSLASLAPQKHVLLLGLPALCGDRASLENLAREIARFYDSASANGALREDPVQYVEAAEVFLELLESEETEAGRDYWRRQNLPDLRALKVSLERQPITGAAFAPAVLNFKLDGKTLAEVERIAAENGTTAPIFFLACWHVLLWRLTGQPEMLVGFASDGRTHEDLKDALGLYERYLPIRSELGSNLAFTEVLQQIEATASEALSRQDYFDWTEIAGFDSGDAKLALCPFMFSFDSQAEADSAADITLRIVRQYSCSDRFKLKLAARRVETGLALSLHYDASLYDRKHAATMARQFLTLVSAATSPATKAGLLNLLDERHRRRLLRSASHPQPATPLLTPFPEMFAQQAARTPDAIAVRDEAGQVTYAELEQRSNQLARYLRRLGAGPEQVVAIHMSRSLQMVEAVLGVLKAGAAYLPLDPNAPAERLQLMIENAGAKVVLTGIDDEVRRESTAPLENVASDQNLAYIIYTSGSTGRPKGVMVQHRSVSEYLAWVNHTLLAGPIKNLPVATNLSFDMCLKQLLAPLVTGNEAWLLPEDVVTQPNALVRALSVREQFGFNCVPSLWKAILDSVEPAEAALLRERLGLLAFGAERLQPSLVQRTFELAPRVQLWNIYGPTEITANACGLILNEGDEITIGRPLSHVTIYLLDEYLHPVPFGVTGELYVGGSGVARGYQSQPELTADKFIPDAFGGQPGARLYRTGDLARLLSDGRIEFTGRADHQVKVRGYRIELGEIETALARHPNVREAVVVAREDVAGDARLVGYVTPKPSHEVRTDELREYLQARLPNYMVPAALVTLKTLPLTPNGKIDRRALPAPEAAGHARSTEIIAPHTPAEKLLTEIWANVLGLDQSEVGIGDNFFELGGDSILAIKIVARANAAGLALATGQLFRHQTIAELAAAAGVSVNVRAQQSAVTGRVPLTPIQHWFFNNPLPNPHHFNQSLMIEIRKSLDVSRIEEVVGHLIAHHDAFRLRFRQEDEQWIQFATPPDSLVPFSRVDVSQHTGQALSSAIEAEAAKAQASLNISDGPLLRVVLFAAGEQEPARLLIVVHHLAMDIVSWSALLEDFHEAYAQLVRGESVQLPAKTTSYKTWSERLQSYARSEELRREAAHWLAPSYQSVSRLPVDYPDGTNDISSVRTFHVALAEDETAALLREIPKSRRAQIHEVLLTALAQAIGWWTGDGVALINVEGHGREAVFDDIDVSRTVGWFTAIYPLLLDVSAAADPDEALRSVMNHVRRTPNGGLGYGVLRYLGDDEIKRKLGSLPQPQVIFNYQGQAHRTEDSPFQVAKESSGPDSGPRGNRRHLLDVNAGVSFDRLKVHWTFSEALHSRSTVEKLAGVFLESLRELIAHCRLQQAPVLMPPPEFAQAGIDEATLQNIMARVKFD